VLILFFSLYLKWFPVAGRGGQGLIFGLVDLVSGRGIQPLFSSLRHLALPAFALAFSVVAWNTRLIRSSMIEVLKADYVRFARAKGLPEFTVVVRHAFRTALIPTITIVGLQMGYLLSGAFIVENVFAWPGIGRLAVQAVSWRDYPLIQAIVAVTAVMFLLINIAVEMLYQIADPRIRHAK
jgi:peptide/nickel transport system permease protein